MFPLSQPSRNYFLNPDESYSSSASFEDTVDLLKSIASAGNSDFSLTENILVIETPQGVFIRSRDTDWCDFLTHLVNDPVEGLATLKIITERDWTNMTTQMKSPVNSFGDNRLARWKVGF